MKEFLLIFRAVNDPDFQPSPYQMQEVMTNWMNWMGGIAAQNKLANRGSRLSLSKYTFYANFEWEFFVVNEPYYMVLL